MASQGVCTGWRAMEITVHPDQRLTELILTLALNRPGARDPSAISTGDPRETGL
jgi:hypothetical protein